jgi:predicted DCC family thiol-disulfide oxidoreductase YuxK
MAERIRVASLPPKPLLIFDGDCGFCRSWVERWRELTGDRVQYEPSQEAATRFPEIPSDNFKRGVQFVETDGTVYSNAEAAFRALSYSRSRRWTFWAYQHVPGFAAITEWVYGIIARHRNAAARVTRILWGESVQSFSYVLTRSLFLRAMGAVYLIAFVSLRLQVDGLYGKQGILPVADYMAEIAKLPSVDSFWKYPTLCWFGTSDTFLHNLCDGGALAACLMMLGIMPILSAIVAWILYLSLMNVGQDFLGFQWDSLLLDAGLLTIFFSPWALTLRRAASSRVSLITLFLLRWLNFRLMLGSGVVKLSSGDKTWRDLTAMKYHYETQPIPTWTSWYMHQLPLNFQKATTVLVFIVELAIPFLIFAPRGLRRIAAFIFIIFQLLLMATGNYAFFNLLTIAICVPLLDDGAWPLRWWRKPQDKAPSRWGWTAIPMTLVAIPLFLLSGLSMVERMGLPQIWPELWKPRKSILGSKAVQTAKVWCVERYNLFSAYGLFAAMTTERPEIIIEGSNDGHEWLAYEFKYKPGDPKRGPVFIAPFQPRLDWQMWFAAMRPIRFSPWVGGLLYRIHEGSPAVLGLLAKNPFPDAPPKYIRAMLYEYRFTNFSNQDDQKLWWRRRLIGRYFPDENDDL